MRSIQYLIIAIIRTINFDIINEDISCLVSISDITHSVTKVELHMRKSNLLSFEYNLSLVEGYTNDIPYNITIGNCLSLNSDLQFIAYPRYFEYRINPYRKNIISSQNVTLELVTNCNDNINNENANNMSIVALSQRRVTKNMQHKTISINKHKKMRRYDNEQTIAFVVLSLIFVVYIAILENFRCMKSEIHRTKIIFKLSKMKRKATRKEKINFQDFYNHCFLHNSLLSSNASKKCIKEIRKSIENSNIQSDNVSKNTVCRNLMLLPCIAPVITEDDAQPKCSNDDIFCGSNDISAHNYQYQNKSYNRSLYIDLNNNNVTQNPKAIAIEQQFNKNIQWNDTNETNCNTSEINNDKYDLEEDQEECLHVDQILPGLSSPYSKESLEGKNDIPVILSTIPDSEEGWGVLFKSIYVSNDLHESEGEEEELDIHLSSVPIDNQNNDHPFEYNTAIPQNPGENKSNSNEMHIEINENTNNSTKTNSYESNQKLSSKPKSPMNNHYNDKDNLQTSKTITSLGGHGTNKSIATPSHLVSYTYNNNNTLTALSRTFLHQNNNNHNSSVLHPSQWSCAEDIPKSPDRLLSHPRVTPKYVTK